MFVYIYTYLCTYVDTIQWYIFIDALLALIFAAGHTRTKHWWLSDYRPLPLLGDAEWDGQGWFFDQELGLITWVACLKKHPEHLKRGIPSEFDAYLWTQNSFHSSSYHCCFYPFFSSLDGCQHHRQAATMGIGLSLLVAFLVLLATTCNWWSSSLGLICGLETLEKKTDSKGLHTPKMTACHRMSPKKGTISKRDYCTSSNPWFFTGIFVRFGGERPCPETKSWNEQLLQLGSFWAWKGVGRRVCRWPDDFLEGKVSPAPKLQGWNDKIWHW